MKLYILRHEEKIPDSSFYTPLSEKGLENADKLIEILKKENINNIYCSPFIRILQTICPYTNKYNIPIKIEYGLSEINSTDIIAPRSKHQKLPEYISNLFNIDKSYKSIINYNETKYPENIDDIKKRIKKIIKTIIDKYKDTDEKIVLVTHKVLCNTILKVILNSVYFKKNISDKDKNMIMTDNYDSGKLCVIMNNNEWEIMFIN